MKPSAHVATSALLATALYACSGSVPAAASCLVSGILIDLDHVLDFHIFSGERFSIANLFSWCRESRWQKITLIFHSYELFGVLCAVAYNLDNALLLGMVWGAGLHLLLDQLANTREYRLSPWFYLMGYRIAVGFRREKLQFALSPVVADPD